MKFLSRAQDGLYLMIVAALSLYFVVGGIAWAVLPYNGRAMPEGLAATVASIGGGLLATLAPRVGKDG
ncbi:MAG: hypothetical protein ACR2HV_01460 [Acidimicrobiales bacterium]